MAARAEAGTPGQLAGILKETRKALKNRQLYSHIENHGEEQILGIYGRFVRFLQSAGEVSLRVEVSSFVWNDIEVFADDAHDINFGYSLYRAGVRVLTIRPGLSWEEFLSFWTLLSNDLTNDSEEDLLTRLWRQGYESISWIAQQRLEEDEDDVAAMKSVTDVLAEAVKNFSDDRLREAFGSEFAGFLTRFSQQSAAQGVLADEQRATTPEQQRTERTRVLSGVATTLLEIAQLRSFAEVEEYFTEAFEQLATALLADRDAMALGSLAEQIVDVLQQPAGEKQGAAVKLGVTGFVRALASPKNLPTLRALLEDPTAMMSPRAFGALVRLLSSEGIQLLLSFFDGKLPQEFRAVVLRVLSNTSPEQAVHLARRVRTADERLGCDLLAVIGTLQVPRRAALCEPALANTSRLVRRTAVDLVARDLDDVTGPPILGRFLERCADIDERIEVVTTLSRFASPESERVLAGRVQNMSLEPRELVAAWRALLNSETPSAYALAGRAAAEPTRGLLGSAKDETKKAALVEALGELADVRSARVLASIAQDENHTSRVLGKRAQDLLAGLKARLGGAGGA